MNEKVSYTLESQIAVIRIANPPVNALGIAVREGIVASLERASSDGAKAVVVIGDGRFFSAGADITEFGKPPKQPILPDVILALESMPVPVIAAIHGNALGGGLEVALACHYRIADPKAKLGLPEVNLGLLPGAGGTQRTPRLMGAEAAIEFMTSGKPISAKQAHELGMVDRLLSGDQLLDEAVSYAQELIDSQAPVRRIGELKAEPLSAEKVVKIRQKLARKTRGREAPQHIVSCVEAACSTEISEGLKTERQLFMECLQSDQSASLRHIFMAERKAAKIDGLDSDQPIREVQSVGIIGAGTMGGGIAMCFANAGIPVKLLEVNQDALDRGLGIVRKNYQRTAAKGRISTDDVETRMNLIQGTLSYDDLATVDLVIEAVFEDPEIKQVVFKKLDSVCKPGAILASNTSYQDINKIAQATQRPSDVVGMHFFSPANVMKLLEVVRGEETADDVVATAMALAKKIRKVAVLVGVCYGFVGNRMVNKYVREAQTLLLEGATPEQVDGAAERWGMAMGPLAMCDLAGLDVAYKARKALKNLPEDPVAFKPGTLLVEAGRLGQKTGQGFYRYDAETRARIADESVVQMLADEAQRLAIAQKTFTDEQIIERLIYPLINEGAAILEEGIAQRASDIDVVYVYGYGFPAHRGGPMFEGDRVGAAEVYRRICEFRDEYGEAYWKPARWLEQAAADGIKIADIQRG